MKFHRIGQSKLKLPRQSTKLVVSDFCPNELVHGKNCPKFQDCLLTRRSLFTFDWKSCHSFCRFCFRKGIISRKILRFRNNFLTRFSFSVPSDWHELANQVKIKKLNKKFNAFILSGWLNKFENQEPSFLLFINDFFPVIPLGICKDHTNQVKII